MAFTRSEPMERAMTTEQNDKATKRCAKVGCGESRWALIHQPQSSDGSDAGIRHAFVHPTPPPSAQESEPEGPRCTVCGEREPGHAYSRLTGNTLRYDHKFEPADSRGTAEY